MNKKTIFEYKNKGMWIIMAGNIMVNKTFKLKRQALKWAKWNYYRGLGNVIIRKI